MGTVKIEDVSETRYSCVVSFIKDVFEFDVRDVRLDNFSVLIFHDLLYPVTFTGNICKRGW